MQRIYRKEYYPLTGVLLFVGMTCSKEEKVRVNCKRALKIVGGVIGVFFLIQVIALAAAFIELNF
ncbi:MAG: hypothetical protein E7478_02265 [Ruminococcaceae bacterium]|nr:hypothetical protein [Oscillospiraceae bacterium]